jgi:hypothetical protein
MGRVELLRENPYVIATQRFSAPPRLMDLDRLTLEEEDLQDIRRCSPGRCGVKLSANEIRELKAIVGASGANWRNDVQQAFREIVLRRVTAFTTGGHAKLEDNWDHKRPTSPAAAFAALVHQSAFVAERVGSRGAPLGLSIGADRQRRVLPLLDQGATRRQGGDQRDAGDPDAGRLRQPAAAPDGGRAGVRHALPRRIVEPHRVRRGRARPRRTSCTCTSPTSTSLAASGARSRDR